MPETNRWRALMRAGRFEDAWTLSDRDLPSRRFVDRTTTPRHFQNIWDGSPVEDRRVLVRCYHGLGDTVQFARYLPRLRDVAREVVVWSPGVLIPLLAGSFDGVEFVPLHDGSPDVAFEVDVEIMELAHVFRTTIDTVPADVPYLHATRSIRARSKPVIGLAWRGGDWDVTRSIPFERVAEFLARRTDAVFVPLHASLTDEEASRFRSLGSIPAVGTIDELARQIADCDLVITVDTLAAHLAGALDVPTWTLLKNCADWRWMLGRSDSPWYPSMRLFRQPHPGAWEQVLDEVNTNLRGVVCHKALA